MSIFYLNMPVGICVFESEKVETGGKLKTPDSSLLLREWEEDHRLQVSRGRSRAELIGKKCLEVFSLLTDSSSFIVKANQSC
jgi:hypothetical protein